MSARDVWARNVRTPNWRAVEQSQRPRPPAPGSYINWRGVEEANRPAAVVAPAGPVQRGIAPTPSTMGSVDPFLASLARDRDAQLGRIRGNFAGFTSELQGALAALIPGFGQIYDRAEASAAATNKAVADRLGVSGAQQETALGQKMQQINAPGTAAADLGGLYKGAAGAGFAYGAADVERLNEEGAAAELFASKMPFITGLEGARVAGQLMGQVEEDYRSQNTNYIKEKAAQDREEARYREEVEREERQRREDRFFEQQQARAAARAREKEFMLTLMSDATAAQRKAAEKRLEREWEKEDARIKREHEIEMAGITNTNISGRQEAGRQSQQDYQSEQNALSRAEQEATRRTNATGWVHVVRNGQVVRTKEKVVKGPGSQNKPGSIAKWQVDNARNAVFRVNNKGQRIWTPAVLRKLKASPGAADGIISAHINRALRDQGLTPAQIKSIRRQVLDQLEGKTWTDRKGKIWTYFAP